ncbi:MOXD1 homolog 1 [Orussus abietinus]|uniref:MOXD1 homolog 1 n=1 Tax=Orussus abietinus TaxID=222816 RepID=UPI0006267C4C|nr:MOXD1 homolog 1 [Orussus abietinus]
MLLFRVALILCTHWVARCDLLDLYVQHMDETMRTVAFKKSQERRVRPRARRSLIEDPHKGFGYFKKQRLDVDESFRWRPKKHPLAKEDGLEYPNQGEKNPSPDQHELLNGARKAQGAQGAARNSSQAPPKRYEGDLGLEYSERYFGLAESEEYLQEFPGGARSRKGGPEEDTESQIELIRGSSSEKTAGSLPGPALKRDPKSGGRTPKKFVPAKGPRISGSAPAKDPKWDTISRDGILERPRRRTNDPKFTRREVLDDAGDVILEWDPSDDDLVVFKVTARTLGYVGIGFNEKSHMKGADILLAWVDDLTGAVNLLDSHGIEETNGTPVTDNSQDVQILEGSQNETHTTVTFSRSWQTCDPQDHRLTGDTVRVLWALHTTDPELNTPLWHGERRGGRALRLKASAPHPPPPKDTPDLRHWDVKLNQFAVSDDSDTVYWCKIFKAPQLAKKHHMIGYTPLVEKANEDLVHHVILYECASTAPILGLHARIVGSPCYSPTMPREWDSCLQPVLAWARGSRGEWLPDHVGIPIAEHREGSYYMLEVHYNNPGLKKVVDSSGVRLHLTPQLRPQEAGILIAGVAVSPLHLVPPRQKEYATAGYCTPHCTNTMFPKEGINVVSVVLHSHLAGKRLGLKHIRQGKELPRIVQDNHFDFNYQQSHTLEKEVKILPGDELVAECVYGTLDRSRPTLGGYAASQEMCLAFVVHYPRTPLAACYSMTPVKDLFRTLGVSSFKGVTVDHLEKLFLTTGTDSVTLPSTTQQQLPVYPATRPSEDVDADLVKEAESALKAMRDFSDERESDNVFARLVIEDPEEFRGRTLAEHMLALPWTEELLARSIERSLYHGRHMTFCRKRDDKLALPADIQNFPNFTALPEVNDTSCSEFQVTSGSDVPGFFVSFFILTTSLSHWLSFF